MTSTVKNDIQDPDVLQAYLDAMEDVHTRFLLNLPPEELATADRILFQIEQAWWFYEDWICDQQVDTKLPRFRHLKPFAVEMFQFSPLLEPGKFSQMWEAFSKYKRKISTYGCILLSTDCTRIVLCQDWNSKSWTLPSGKINQGEGGLDASARETWEETGFDPNCKYGLTQQYINPTWKHPLQEKDSISYTDDIGKHRTYYVCHGVPEDFPFEPVARKEVSAVQWHPLTSIPKKNFAVLPVLPKLRRWIKRNIHHGHNKRDKSNPKHGRNATPRTNRRDGSNTTPLKSNKTPNRKDLASNQQNNSKTPNRDRKKQGSRPRSRGKSPAIVSEDDPLLESGLADVGAENRWSEEEMFQANEKLLGRKIEYDGNPHVFAENGFGGMDPHHFHIVGGKFLNADSAAPNLAPPPEASRLQHLFRSKSIDEDAVDDNEVLTPFFSDDGATPWGEVVEEIKETVASPQRTLMLSRDQGHGSKGAQAARKGKNSKNKRNNRGDKETVAVMATDDNADSDLVFMTDLEITQRSQQIKLAQHRDQQYEQNLKDIQAWVDNLPQPPPTKYFGQFKFDADALMDALYQHY